MEAVLEWASVIMPPQTSPDIIPLLPQAAVTVTPGRLNNPEDMLDAPYGLEAEATSPHTINVTWSAPRLVNIGYYSVMIKEVQSSHSSDSAKPILINW